MVKMIEYVLLQQCVLIFEIENPKKTACGLFMDKEEIGSMG